MEYKNQRKIDFGVILPVIIYMVAQFAAELTGAFIIMMNRAEEVVTVFFSQDTEQLNAFILRCTEELVTHYLAVLSLGSLFALPVALYLFKKEQKEVKEKEASEANKVNRVDKVSKVDKWTYVAVAVMGMAICLVMDNFAAVTGRAGSRLYTQNIVLAVIGGCLIIPIVEEVLFRGVMYHRLKRKMPYLLAAPMSAFAFGIVYGGLVPGSFGFITGCLAAYIYDKIPTIKAPIIMRIFMNAGALLFAKSGITAWIYEDKIRFFCATAFFAAIGIGGFLKIKRESLTKATFSS